MERNELMAFPNCRFENFWPFGICCLFLPRWEKESRDNICCVTAAVVSNRNTPWNHHLSLCNLTVRRRKVEEKTAAVHEQDGCVFEEGDAEVHSYWWWGGMKDLDLDAAASLQTARVGLKGLLSQSCSSSRGSTSQTLRPPCFRWATAPWQKCPWGEAARPQASLKLS